jgi:hypothetical protein
MLFRVLCVLALPLVPGCAAAVIAHKVMGPPPIPAQYVPAKEPMLVLVENYHNPSATAIDGRFLELRIEEELQVRNIAPVIRADRLESVRSDPAYEKMTIPAIGRAVGAKQVLYVNVRAFGVESTVGGEMIKGNSEATVRVVDAATGDTRWPNDNPTGYPLKVTTPWLRQGADATEASLRDRMADQTADALVKLFRKYSPDDDEGPVE